MKNKSKILAGLVVALILAYGAASAQVNGPAVKILPSTEDGVLKVMYAYSSSEPIKIRFTDAQNLNQVDYIGGENFPSGFSKKYDIRNIEVDAFWIEVKSSKLSVVYKMTAQKDGTYHPLLEKTTYYHDLVAANN